MRRRLAILSLTLGLALAAPALGVADVPLACAATDQRAALVVDTGGQARSYCVALGADAVSGTELIRLAHDQYGLDYRLGFGGRAVCRLSGVGVDGGDCFGAYPDFWGYWHGDGGGGWTWASGSAADWSVEAGDVEGWQWGPGQDGATHASPPATRADDVCEPAEPEPSPPPDGGAGGNGGGAGNGSGGGGSPGGADAAPDPSSDAPSGSAADREPLDRQRHDAGQPSPSASVAPSPTGAPPVVLAAGERSGEVGGGGGAGAGRLIALAAVVVLGTAGALALRRRRAG